jgi:thiamine biosynthesis lipoprotein
MSWSIRLSCEALVNLRNLLPYVLLAAGAFALTWLLLRSGDGSDHGEKPEVAPQAGPAGTARHEETPRGASRAPQAYPVGTLRTETRAGAVRVVDIRAPVMGTRFVIEVAAPDEVTGREACRRTWFRILELEQALSTWRPDSLLSRVNREASERPVSLDPETHSLLRTAGLFVERSGGAFDPTVGPLVRLWRQAAAEARVPDPRARQVARSTVGYSEAVELGPADRPTIRFLRPGVTLDLGAIAKGYAADVAAWNTLVHGATAVRVNAGGDHVALGAPPWSPEGFEVAVRDPAGGETDRLPGYVFPVTNHGVATSGNYERFTEIDGRRYSHIIDPRSGEPVESPVLQVTVLAPTGTAADAMATALAVLGLQDGLALVEADPDLEALFLERREGEIVPIPSRGFPGGPR